jgi:hypothetical protein
MTALQWSDSRRLWSLWDMLKLNAEAFYEAVTIMAKAGGYIEFSHKEIEHPDGGVSFDIVDAEALAVMRSHADDLMLACSSLEDNYAFQQKGGSNGLGYIVGFTYDTGPYVIGTSLL